MHRIFSLTAKENICSKDFYSVGVKNRVISIAALSDIYSKIIVKYRNRNLLVHESASIIKTINQ